MSKTILQMAGEVVEYLQNAGWNDSPVTFPDAMVNLHSEISEAFHAWRDHEFADTTNPYSFANIPKPEGVGSEMADVLIRLLDTCSRWGIDLDVEYERKMEYNRTRPYRHGGKHI